MFFFLSRVSLVQENYFPSLIFLFSLSLYSFSTLLVNLSLKLLNLLSSVVHNPLKNCHFINSPSLLTAAEVFPAAAQKHIMQNRQLSLQRARPSLQRACHLRVGAAVRILAATTRKQPRKFQFIPSVSTAAPITTIAVPSCPESSHCSENPPRYSAKQL